MNPDAKLNLTLVAVRCWSHILAPVASGGNLAVVCGLRTAQLQLILGSKLIIRYHISYKVWTKVWIPKCTKRDYNEIRMWVTRENIQTIEIKNCHKLIISNHYDTGALAW